MKLHELFESDDANVEESDDSGIYAAAKFSQDTVEALSKAITNLQIPNPTPDDEFHCTIIYSETSVSELWGEVKEFDPPLTATPDKFHFFESASNGTQCLVILLKDCPELHEMHESMVNDYGAVYAFDEYMPHVTLSYDYDNQDILDANPQDYIQKLEIVKVEYKPISKKFLKSVENDSE